MHAAPVLRVTKRCLVDDLGLPADTAESPVETIAGRHPIIAAFVQQRSQNPQGQEIVERLKSRIVAWTLHSGEFRGATWHDESSGIVWLLAARFHRSGQPDDAYPYFRALDADQALLPVKEDILLYERITARTLAQAVGEEVPVLTDRARQLTGTIVTGLLGGRIRVRLLMEAGPPETLTVAYSERLQPGDLEIPRDWPIVVMAAFFPHVDWPEFSPCLGHIPVRKDEAAYRAEM